MQTEHVLRFGSYRFTPTSGQLWRGTHEVKLTPKALAVLRVLVLQPGQVITKDALFQSVWSDTVVSDDALTSCIQELRQALGDKARQPRFIETVHRRGYRFIALLNIPQPVVSSQHSVASREEEDENQKPKGNNTEQAESLRLQAEGPPSSSPHTHNPPPQPEQTLDPTRQTLDVSAPLRFWRIRKLIWLAVVLLLGVSATGLYRASFRTPQSIIHTQEALPLPDKPSIIVLPFQNLSGDPGQDYFSDGLTEILTGDLSRISSLFVIARNSAFTYKGKAVKVQEVGREMGVRYVLEGSVLRADGQVRITMQLIDATTGYHLWSERYDRPLQNIFALQDEIVQRIVTTLKLQLTLREQGQLVHKTTDNLDAYDSYLRGVEYFWRLTKEANAQARHLFEKAVALDPQYAEAYARLGVTYYLDWIWRWSADPQTLERALRPAQQALALDDSLPFAHSLLSFVYAQNQQHAQALAESERAIALDPNNADNYAWQVEVLNLAGRPEEALRAVEKAMRLNPHYPPFYLFFLGWTYDLTGRHAEAAATLKEVIRRSPDYLAAHMNLAGSYTQQWLSQQSTDAQTLEQALEAAQRGIALSDSLHWSHIHLGYVYLFQKQYEQALAEMERAVALAPTEAKSYATLAVVLGSVGRFEDAQKAAEQALRLKPYLTDNHLAEVGAVYAAARRHEEAIALLQRYLSRYPHQLFPHLTLAVVYSELGRDAEAQAEATEVLQLNPQFSLAVHKERMPVKDPAMLERHIAALRKAGLK